MARRNWSDAVDPRKVVKDLGEVTPYSIARILQTCETMHRERKFHETSKFLEAAQLAVRLWIDAEVIRAADEHTKRRAWQKWPDAIVLKPAAAAQGLAAVQSNRSDAGVGSQVAGYGNGAGDLARSSPALQSNSAGLPCRCGHSYTAHAFGKTGCTARDENDDDCECDGYEPPPPPFVTGSAANDLCECGHKRIEHEQYFGTCVTRVDWCECQKFEQAPDEDGEGGEGGEDDED